MTDSRGRDHLVYRGGPTPHGCMYERRDPRTGGWDLLRGLSRQRIQPGYTFVGATLTIDPADVLYCAFIYYNMAQDRSDGACVLRSDDAGETWTHLDGRAARLPLDYDPSFALPSRGPSARTGGLAIDSDGNLVGLATGQPDNLLSIWRGDGWETTKLSAFLPGWNIRSGTVTVDAKGRILIACDAMPEQRLGDPDTWGHRSTECFLLASNDGGASFEAVPISRPTTEAPNWLPNISRTGPGREMTSPLVIYTEGGPGEGCAPEDRTKVWAVWVC